MAAEHTGLDVEVLHARLTATPGREEVFVRTIRAAAEAAVDNKLYALASALAAIAGADGDDRVAWEGVFVRTVADIESVHCEVLERFTRSANSLGLGDGSDGFESPVSKLNTVQLEMILPRMTDILDVVMAVLSRHGLVAELPVWSGPVGASQRALKTWGLTQYGTAVLGRLGMLGTVLKAE